MDTKGQMTVVGVMLLFLTLMVLGALMPTITDEANAMKDDFTNESMTYEAILVGMIPMFIIVAFLATIALYAGPQIGTR